MCSLCSSGLVYVTPGTFKRRGSQCIAGMLNQLGMRAKKLVRFSFFTSERYRQTIGWSPRAIQSTLDYLLTAMVIYYEKIETR